MKKYLFAYTISGEGYSEPQFKLFSDKGTAEKYLFNKVIAVEDETGESSRRKKSNKYLIEADDNYHMLQLIEIKDGKDFALVYYFEPNEVKVLLNTDSEDLVKQQLKLNIKRTKWDRGEEKWDGNSLAYGAHARDGYEHFEIVGEEEDTTASEKEFPNGFTSWMETHHEIVTYVSIRQNAPSTKIAKYYDKHGTGGIYKLAEDWTDEFEKKNKGKEWDGNYFDAVEEFVMEKEEKLK